MRAVTRNIQFYCSGLNAYTRLILSNPCTASTASLSDEDAVYLIESVVGGLHICKRYDPYRLRGPSTVYTRKQKRLNFGCVPSDVGLPRLFVGRLAIQGGLESGASARAIFVTGEPKSTNLTRVTSVCAK